jgi:hypothetical protein
LFTTVITQSIEMKKSLYLLILLLTTCQSKKESFNFDFTTRFEKSNGMETATYEEVIEFYEELALKYSTVTVDSIGLTDSGKPLNYVSLNPEKINDKTVTLLINNGIHPGESDGIDATMLLFRDIASGKIEAPIHTKLITIPIYNVGGSLNRNSTTRTNQNGPEAYGFRGNARNFDLNRDFIKCDTENAKSFTQLFHKLNPDLFIDNHVSNGADYQYTLTHLFTQHNKLGSVQGEYLNQILMPQLEQKLIKKDWDITPYVNVFNQVPETGFTQFMDYPRYSTGYTLFNTLGMMVETHMLKPYKQRVLGTYELMKSMIDISEEDYLEIAQLKIRQANHFKTAKNYTLEWSVDTSKTTTLQFKGFEGEFITSEITGQKRLKFDTKKPFTKPTNYNNYFIPELEISVPKAYVIPKGWHNIIELLKLNNVELKLLKRDTTIKVEVYKIENFETRKSPYEGHYQHYNTKISSKITNITFSKGDYMIETNQPGVRYLLETLEPQAPDSFFNWNFFDTILQQKEGFSPYVWEDKALELLKNNPQLKTEFDNKKSEDSEFANNWYAQLDWLHKNSPNYESAHLTYPVYRIKKQE